MSSLPAARPEPFQLCLPIFTGDVQSLLTLVSEGKLGADVVPMAQIAEQFACYLQRVDILDLEMAGDFLSVSSRLLLMKSARLLAAPPAEDADREDRYTLGWVDRPTLTWLAAELRGREGDESMAPLVRPELVERRLQPRPRDILSRSWRDMVGRQGNLTSPVAVPAFVHLEAAVSGLIRKLKATARLSFRRLIRDTDRRVAVMHFLAVLELIRRRQATAIQEGLFEDITIEYGTDAGETVARAG